MKIKELLESRGAEYNTAMQLAKELHLNLEDLSHIAASGSRIAAGNPHNVASLKQDIRILQNEIMDLGFEYDPSKPNLIKPLSV